MIIKTSRKWHGREYSLFDWCQTEEEAKMELKEIRDAGYLARRTRVKEGFHIWSANKKDR